MSKCMFSILLGGLSLTFSHAQSLEEIKYVGSGHIEYYDEDLARKLGKEAEPSAALAMCLDAVEPIPTDESIFQAQAYHSARIHDCIQNIDMQTLYTVENFADQNGDTAKIEKLHSKLHKCVQSAKSHKLKKLGAPSEKAFRESIKATEKMSKAVQNCRSDYSKSLAELMIEQAKKAGALPK